MPVTLDVAAQRNQTTVPEARPEARKRRQDNLCQQSLLQDDNRLFSRLNNEA
jgi:hypothetical protein